MLFAAACIFVSYICWKEKILDFFPEGVKKRNLPYFLRVSVIIPARQLGYIFRDAFEMPLVLNSVLKNFLFFLHVFLLKNSRIKLDGYISYLYF